MTLPVYFKAISWNIVNVFLYKCILQTHQAFLFYTINQELFGLSGTLFAATYFLISVTNIGFDYFVITHHQTYTASQSNFKKLFSLFWFRMGYCALALTILYILGAVYHTTFLYKLTTNLEVSMLCLLGMIFIFESLKKSLDNVAQMSFLQKSITFFDISTLLAYIILVWSSYLIQHTISLYTLFVPMLGISIIECCLLAWRLRIYVTTLPAHQPSSTPRTPTKSTMLKQQIANYINQITKALFSPNFFIILLASYLGFGKAGYIKLFTDIIILMYMLLNRSFGMPSAALLSSINSTASNQEHLKQTFMKITHWYIQFLYVLGVAIMVTIIPCLIYHSCISKPLIINILLFMFAGFIEYVMVSYEKWYLIQNQAWILATINTITLLSYIMLLIYAQHIPYLSSHYILLPIIWLRLTTLVAVVYVSYRIWHITPSWKINKTTTYIILVITILGSIWHSLYIK